MKPLLIVDEIATGFGRTGTMFAHEQLDLRPDIVCLGKGSHRRNAGAFRHGRGSRVYDAFRGTHDEMKQFFHGHSYAGNPIACAAALANLELFERETALARVTDLAAALQPQLAQLRLLRAVRETREAGLMIGIEIDSRHVASRGAITAAWRIANELYERGHFTRPIEDVIQLVPPLSSTREELRAFLGDLDLSYLQRVDAALAAIREQERYRDIPPERSCVADFSSNDYLALATDSRMVEAMRHVKRVGAGGARLLGGRHREHALLENDIARWIGRERALLFSSGYMAALGAVQVLAPLVSVIYSDALNHACLIDGIRAVKTPREIVSHAQLPPKAQRHEPALIVTESLFGMDGDRVDLRTIVRDLREDDILLVDEAHALGLCGEQGAGIAHGMDDPRIIVLGTLSKALGAAGGFIAGPHSLVELLINAARTFIFDSAPPPPIAFAGRVGIMLARTADDRRERLFSKSARLRAGLRTLGFPALDEETPIVPIVLGEERRAIELMQRCAERGIIAPAIRPPTVPAGTSRLRISVRSDHTDEQIDLLLEQLACCIAT